MDGLYTADDFIEEIEKDYDRSTEFSKDPLKHYAHCKRCLHEMLISHETYDKIIKIIIEDLGI